MATIYGVMGALQQSVKSAVAGILVSNLETVTITGQPTVGDVVSLTLTSGGITGSPLVVSYTVKAADTLQAIGNGLAAAINASPALRQAKVLATPTLQAGLQVQYPTALTIAWTSGVSGAATEVVGLVSTAQIAKSGVGWPPITALQNVARGGALITVYDRKIGKNTTRWSPFPYNQVVIPCTTTTSVANAGGSITLGGSVTPGDAVSCVISAPVLNQPRQTAAVVVSGIAGDTPVIMATKLAAAINADAVLSQWVSAAAVGAVVTLSPIVPALSVQSYAGNGGTQTRELARTEKSLQVVIWARTEEARALLVDALQGMLADAQVNFGPTTPDGQPVRLEMQNDYALEDDTLEDVYRHDFLISVDFAITTQDQLYSVLAPIPSYAVETVTVS